MRGRGIDRPDPRLDGTWIWPTGVIHAPAENTRPDPEAPRVVWMDMGIIRSTAALVGRLGFGLLALGAMSQPLRNGVPTQSILPRAPKVGNGQGRIDGQAPRDWSLQVDEASLSTELNGWAADQAQVQTPLGMAQLEDLTVKLRDDQIALHATGRAAWFERR